MSRSPFSGMDPYLEISGIWRDVHTSLMNIFREQLAPNLSPKYVAELETEIIIDQIFPETTEDTLHTAVPDVSIVEPQVDRAYTGTAVDISPAPLQLTLPATIETRLVTIHIRHRELERVVTVIELLSPINKRRGQGRNSYLKKRLDYLQSTIHLVEIDLLRKHPRMPFGGRVPKVPYMATVSYADKRNRCDAWPIKLPDRLPVIPIPLRRPDPAVPLDIQQALNTAYERARYDLRLNYDRLPPPPLTQEEKKWLQSVLNLPT